ncbi:MAG: Asp-tRNA(Asn)/Glu-tRNA(Gln) amidotransferase subunit GatA [Lachnospiraceae bacterium]|nr:Asp-tRNA(Asn)/Glu-tRNA(Gln) amidotransferase subunit GatA [Lachnospiraceae bacterium]
MSALELGQALKRGDFSVEESTAIYRDRIKALEPKLNAFISIEEERLQARVQEVKEGIATGKYTGPLAGVPVAIKDNICTHGLRTTCGSKILENFVPTYQAEVINRLENAGMIIMGKTNMDEFAMGSTTETSAYGITRNPWNEAYVPGGSSGGSCVAVAAGEAPLALGSDTGGSIRQPASHCGVVGLKPTYGRVSRYGLIAYASSMDQIGPIGRTVADCKAFYEVIAGYDAKDSTSSKAEPVPYIEKELRIAVPKNYLESDSDSKAVKADLEVCDAIHQAIRLLEHSGAKIEYVSMPMAEYATQAYYVIACAEASSNLARFDGVKYGYRSAGGQNLHCMYRKTRAEGFGKEVKRRIMAGAYALSEGYYEAYYLKALKVKALIQAEFEKIFEEYDCILAPVTPTVAPMVGESLVHPIKMYQSDAYTVAVNLTGLPAISVPCGLSGSGLPIGMQLIANRFEEEKLFALAGKYEVLRGELGRKAGISWNETV